jgi:sec-independent protein translocase protein TatA
MFELGGGLQEILLIMVVALLVVGPKRLPEVGRMLALALRELRSVSAEFRSTLETHLEINEPVVRPLPPAQPHQSVISDDEASTPYVAQRGGRLFHRRECPWASRISRNDRVGLPAAADAERDGFVSCPACENDRELTPYSTDSTKSSLVSSSNPNSSA